MNGAELKFKEFEVISSLVSEKLGRAYSDYFYKQLNFLPKEKTTLNDNMTREKMKSEMAQVYLIKNGFSMELLLLPERYIFELVRDLKKIDYGYL